MRKSLLLLMMVLLLVIPAVLGQDETPDVEPPVTQRDTAPDANAVQFVTVSSGFNRPIFVTNAGDGTNRLFVMEQGGQVWILRDDIVQTPAFLDVSDLLHADVHSGRYTERGLLGLAFHPNFAENGYFYINYNDLSGATVVARYAISAENPDVADPASAHIIFTLAQPYPNHNGGHMAFGLDGYLYISVGDGGSANDPQGNGQNRDTLLGTILRIDVNAEEGYSIPEDNPFVNADGADEIWAYGLRNVWRFSFDRATGDLYSADVGQNQWEEVNFQPADSPGGENYGWNVFEGLHTFSGAQAPADMVLPIAEYDHSAGCSITGGYVYRGQALADEMAGVYLFGDWCSGNVWAAYRDLNGGWRYSVFLRTSRQISSFGEDEAGELYLVDYSGVILRLQRAS